MAIDSLLHHNMCNKGGHDKGELQQVIAFPEFTYSCNQASDTHTHTQCISELLIDAINMKMKNMTAENTEK